MCIRDRCTIADIKAYRPEEKSVGAGQVLQSAYDFQKTRNVVREMADALALELVAQRLVTDQVVLTCLLYTSILYSVS